MMAGAGVSVGGGAGMLRTRRRDVSVKPNRKLDRKSSRGMIYENEELRLRTIHINAEVEQGQNDIKKLRRENEQLRREIWSLRDEYDKLEEILKRQQSRPDSEEYEDRSDEDDGLRSDYSDYEEDEGTEEQEKSDQVSEDCKTKEQLENVENDKISSEKMSSNGPHRLHVDFDDLSVVDEEEELKKEKEKKEVTSYGEGGGSTRQKDETETPSVMLRPRQLHENIPFYPATYEPSSNTFSSSSYYTDCPFEFPSTVDLMLPTDTSTLLASPCSRLRADPLISLASFDASNLEQVTTDQMLPRIHVPPPVGWQANLVLPQEQLATYPTMNVTSATLPTSTGIPMSVAPDRSVSQQSQSEQQPLVSCRHGPLQRRKQFHNSVNTEPCESLNMQHSNTKKHLVENGWPRNANLTEESKIDSPDGEGDMRKAESANAEGMFTFGESEKPKHFFSPLPSKVKRQTEENSPTTSSSQFGTGSSSSGKTGSTVISKSQFMSQKGSADIYVNGAITFGDSFPRDKDEQRPFLSSDNLLLADDKSNIAGQLMKSLSYQDLSESQNPTSSGQLRIQYGEGTPQMFTQSDNTLDCIASETPKPFKSHLNVTLRTPKTYQVTSAETPEIPKLPSIDCRIFNNPFLKTFDPTRQKFLDEQSAVTRPLSVQVTDDSPDYKYDPLRMPTFGTGVHAKGPQKALRNQADSHRLLIPSNQLVNGKILSPLNKPEVQITSFERPSPHTLVSPSRYDLNALRKVNTNPYLQNYNLYQNVPFVPGEVLPHYYQPRGPMRIYYENLARKVSAQTQTSIDGDSHQEDEKIGPQRGDSVSAPSSPNGQRRKRTTKREKTPVSSKDQKPLSPTVQKQLKKQSSVTSTETAESSNKQVRRPRKLSVTTTTASDAQEEKNESRSSSSGQDSPRKEQARRVSLYFNAKKRPSLTSVKTTRSASLDTSKDKYMDGLVNSERERTNSISSRETNSVKPRKASTSSGNVPWCACWGNGCI